MLKQHSNNASQKTNFDSKPLKDLDEWQDVKAEELQICDTGKQQTDFRNYSNSARQDRVQNFYKLQHENQTVNFVKRMHEKYLKFNHCKMGIWECLEMLDSIVDDSDPDTDVSQLQHALMTAEAIRKKFPGKEYEWFTVVGLIHDLGKIMALKYDEPQWAVVGDTFPVGCKWSDKCVFPQFFQKNSDLGVPEYQTQLGIYKQGCGLSNLRMSWGHDEYLYQVCVHNKCTLPVEGLYMIRFHSFYPWHRENEYSYFMDDQDHKMLPWVREFNPFDLYSKGDLPKDVTQLCNYYKKLILKFFPEKLEW